MHNYPANRTKFSGVFLIVLGTIAGYTLAVAGGAIAQSHGDLRERALISILLTGLLGVLYWTFMRPLFRLGSRIDIFVLLFPAYILCQIVPLPLTVVRILSPTRALLADALAPSPSYVPLSVAPPATLYHFLVFIACAIIFYITSDLTRRFFRRPWIVVLPLVLLAAAESLLGLAQVAANSGAVATGTYLIRNHYAGFLEMVLPFSALYPFAVLASRGPQPQRTAAPMLLACAGFSVTILLAAAIVGSLSRMGFFAALISLTFALIVAVGYGTSRRRLSRVLPVIVLLGLIGLVFVPSARLVMRFEQLRGAAQDRPVLWHETIHLIQQYPVFGCGLGGFESAFLKFKIAQPGSDVDYAHNDYLQYLAELGIAGFALAITPLILILIRLRAAWKRHPPDLRFLALACGGSALAIGIHSFVDFNLYVPANLFTFAWILGIAARVGETGNDVSRVHCHVESTRMTIWD